MGTLGPGLCGHFKPRSSDVPGMGACIMAQAHAPPVTASESGHPYTCPCPDFYDRTFFLLTVYSNKIKILRFYLFHVLEIQAKLIAYMYHVSQ